jgi:ribosomal protein L15
MQINNLKQLERRKLRRRIARGGKRGATSGRGQNGQLARTGGNKGLTLKIGRKGGFLKSIPLLGGFKSISKRTEIVKVTELIKRADKFTMPITRKQLKQAKLITKRTIKVKIIGGPRNIKLPQTTKQITLSKGILFSDSLKKIFSKK